MNVSHVLFKSAYVHDIENGQPENRQKEYELSDLWASAAAAFYGVDSDLSPLFALKSEAWAAPTQWPAERVREFGITLDAVSEKARIFLHG